MDLQTSKNIGGVGALLLFIGPLLTFVHSVGGLTSLIGLILVLIALKGFADRYNDSGIFNNALYGLIVGIVGGVVAVGTIILTVLVSLTDFLYEIFPGWNGDWTTLSGLTPDLTGLTLDSILPFITGILVGLIVLWVFAIITFYLVRRSLTSLSAKSNVGLFSITGLLMLIGAVLIVAFGIGLLLIWISFLLIAIAFFQIKPTAAEPPPSPPPP